MTQSDLQGYTLNGAFYQQLTLAAAGLDWHVNANNTATLEAALHRAEIKVTHLGNTKYSVTVDELTTTLSDGKNVVRRDRVLVDDSQLCQPVLKMIYAAAYVVARHKEAFLSDVCSQLRSISDRINKEK